MDGTNGFRIDGVDAGDQSGYSVSDAGDVNGDGFGDVIIGAWFADLENNASASAGESYVVFGASAGFSASFDLSALDGSNGFRIDGVDSLDQSGFSVSGAGDVNGDGFDDVIVGALGADLEGNGSGLAGESYVVFGASTGFSASLDVSSLDGNNGFRIDGVDSGDRSGRSVSGAGDVNGDGYDDVIVGAFFAALEGSGSAQAGESYVVFGASTGFGASFDLSTLDGSNGFRIDGVETGDWSGYSVSDAGDVNGDGYGDLIIGARLADLEGNGSDSAGESYVVFGASAGFGASLDLSSLDGTNGFRIDGVDSGDQSGFSVSSAGDVNGDGYDDVIVGARLAALENNGTTQAGESYVVFGASAGFGASLELSSLDGTNGFRIDGVDSGDSSGISVSGAGDVNGDGYDDLIIGAQTADLENNGSSQAGESYVVFGASTGFGASLDLSTLDGSNGFRIDGVVAGDRSGFSVSGAGDVNGDGFDDVIVGAPDAGLEGSSTSDAGESYVIFGFSASAVPIAQNDSASVDEDSQVAIDVASNDTDAEGGTPDITSIELVDADDGSDGLRKTIEGEGIWLVGKLRIIDPVLGVSEIELLAGQIGFTPDPDFDGTPTPVFYTIADDTGARSEPAEVSVTLTPVNDPPVATPDTPSGDTNTTINGTVAATDADGDNVTFAKASDPSNGTVDVATDGSYAYIPEEDFFGTDTFDVTASDGNGGEDTVTVTVTVNETFEITTYQGSLPTPFDRVETGERVVAASASSGATVTFSGEDGDGVVYDPSTAGGAFSDTLTVTLENGEGVQRTQIFDVSIIGLDRELNPVNVGFGSSLEFDGEQLDFIATLENQYSGRSVDIDGNFSVNIGAYDGAGASSWQLPPNPFFSTAMGLGTITNAPSTISLGNGPDFLDLSDAPGDYVVFGGEGIQTVWAGPGNNLVFLNADDDIAHLGPGDDTYFSSGGFDGNDDVDGGSDTDTAIYSGLATDYVYSVNADGSLTISDQRGGDVNNGTDTLRNFEVLQFSGNELVPFASLLVSSPSVVDPGPIKINEGTSGPLIDLLVVDTTDREGAGLTFSITGTLDDALFSIDEQTGLLSWQSGAAPDFEIPSDENGDSVYELEVSVTASDGGIGTRNISIEVLDFDYVPSGPEFLVNSETDENQTRPVVTELSTGGFAIAWATDDASQDGDGGAIKAQVFGADGQPSGNEILVNSQFVATQSNPEIESLSNGDFVVSWVTQDPAQDGESFAIKARIFAADGTPRGSEFLVNSDATQAQLFPEIAALNDGGFVIVWDGPEIEAQIFNADGSKRDGQFQVNSSTEEGVGRATIASLDDGGFAVAWETSDFDEDSSTFIETIQFRSFDTDGSPRSGDVQIRGPEVDTDSVSISGLSNGNTVVVWYEFNSEIDNSFEIRGHLIGADGTPIGTAFSINNETENSQFEAKVVGLSDGGFAVVWYSQDFNQDGSSSAIKARLFDSNANPVGNEFLVNTEFTGNQIFPDIAETMDGNLVLTWWTQDPLQDGSGSAIKARIFLPDNSPPQTLADSDTVVEDGSVEIDVLGNDTDVDSALDPASVEIEAADADTGNKTKTVAGQGVWSVDDSTGAITFTPEADYNGTVTDISYTVADVEGLRSTPAAVSVAIIDVNDPPSITSSATASVPENQTSALDVDATDDNDSEGAGLSYAITGGADQALFDIDTNTGVLTFLAAPDFENPGDANTDNDYLVQVTVTDSGGLTDVQDITISVTDEIENLAPNIITSALATAPENQTFALDVQTIDDNDSEGAGLTYAITGGVDDGLFDIDSTTGVLTFLSAPDFEAPDDSTLDNDYEVQVTVTDSGGLTDVVDFTISVTDEDDDSDFTYTLVDTQSDTEVGALFDGVTFDPGPDTPANERSILVDFIGDNVAGDDDGSLRLQLFDENDNLVAQRLENAAPYLLFGDSNGNFFDPSTPLVDGDYSLTVTQYSQNGAGGTILGMETIEFTLGEVTTPLPTLTLAIDPASISENGGMSTGTVTRTNTSTVGDLTVTLASNDLSEAFVAPLVTIPDGQASVTFQIDGVDDMDLDGDQNVTISASATGFVGDSAILTVEDDEVPPPPDPELDLTIDMASISEDGGTATGTVTRSDGTTGNVTVMLASDDTSEATVPSMVTILDGFDSVDFQITAVDDMDLDGDQLVTISAAATGFDGDSETITIEDDEVPPPATAGFEIGSVTVEQLNGSQFFNVTFAETIEDARVVMGPVSFNGVQQATTRVQNVTDQGFQFQVEEWNYLDGAHITETIFWMAMSEGEHTLADGTAVSAGRTTLVDDTPATVSLSGFSDGPAVFGQVSSYNGTDAVADRISNVSSNSFTVRMQEEENLQNGHVQETFDWIAIEYGDGADIDVENLAALGSTPDNFVFDAKSDVAVLADMQTFLGVDTAVLRYDDLDTDSVSLFVEEEQSADAETFHLDEQVALLTAETGTYDLFS